MHSVVTRDNESMQKRDLFNCGRFGKDVWLLFKSKLKAETKWVSFCRSQEFNQTKLSVIKHLNQILSRSNLNKPLS